MSLIRKFNQLLTQEDPLSFRFLEIFGKIICFSLVVVCLGLPITDMFRFTALFISGLGIVCGKFKRSLTRLIFAVLIALTVFLINSVLPHAALQEGHNVFLVTKDKGALEKGLPPEVFDFIKEQYLKRYPADNWERHVPHSLFSYSADSVFSKPKYSRIVDRVNFHNLTEFRGGFVNSDDYNWFGDSVIKRESMPFFVMYELSPASVGSALCWTGYVMWEGPRDQFTVLYQSTEACRKITVEDVGKRIFGSAINNVTQMGFRDRMDVLKAKVKPFLKGNKGDIFLPDTKEAALSMRLSLSSFLKFFGAIKIVLQLAGVLSILFFLIKVNWRRFAVAILVIILATAITYVYCPELFGQYYIHDGGEDGITHQTLGRKILAHAISGDWRSAVRGEQDVFWDTPGFRYFRASEKLFFGDTNLGYLTVLLLLPYIFFGFLSCFLSKKWSFWVTIVFLLGLFLHPHPFKPNLGFAYHLYIAVVRGGWPDTLAYACFLGGLTLLLRYANLKNGAYFWYGFWGNFLLSMTVFMRPQFVVSAILVVFYFFVKLIQQKRCPEAFFSTLGFFPAAFPCLHNHIFGHKFFLFTGAIDMAVKMPPSVYLDALKESISFDFAGANTARVVTHVKNLIGPGYRLIFLGIVFYAAFFKRKIPADMRMIAVICLSLHFVNLFIFAIYFRYVFLSWALTVVVALFLVYLWLGGKRK